MISHLHRNYRNTRNNNLMRHIIPAFLSVIIAVTLLAGCGTSSSSSSSSASSASSNGKLKVIATIFPEYDFLRQIGGDRIDLKMLLKPGAESHSYEPTPQDMKDVADSDMFVYVGGDSDAWISSIMDSIDKKKIRIVTLMDCVSLVPEETVE